MRTNFFLKHWLRVSIRVCLVIRHKFQLQITSEI